jgi:hypothetical protein
VKFEILLSLQHKILSILTIETTNMTRLILFVLGFFLLISAKAQTSVSREFHSHDYERGIITEDFIVLDINYDEQLVAFKHIFKLREVYGEMGDLYKHPFNCKYIGLEDKPYSAVVLGVYDLKEQKYLKTFTVYKAAYEEKDCSPYSLSVKMLDSAKTFFIKHNLDIAHKPTPIKLEIVDGAVDFPLMIDSVVTFTYRGINFSYDNIWESDGNVFYMNTKSQLFVKSNDPDQNKKLLYVINQQDSYNMASGGRIDYLAIYESNGKFVFLNRFRHYNHLSGGTDKEVYHFSPVFNLSDFTEE